MTDTSKNSNQPENPSTEVKLKKNNSLKIYYAIAITAAIIISVILCIALNKNEDDSSNETENISSEQNVSENAAQSSNSVTPENNVSAIPSPSDNYAPETVILQIGNSKMTTTQFQFFLDNAKQQMIGNEVPSAEEFESTQIDGKSALDIAKERAYTAAVECLSNIEIAKKKGHSYSQEDFDNAKALFNPSLFSQYENSEEIITLMCETNIYMAYLQNISKEEITLNDSDIESYFNLHKDELSKKYMNAKYVFISTVNPETNEPLSEEEIEQKRTEADNILAQAKNGADFDSLVSQYSQDKNSTSGQVFASGTMDSDFEDCVKSLALNEIGFLKTSSGFYIIQKSDLNAASCKPFISDSVYSEKFAGYIKNLIQEYNLQPQINDTLLATLK